MSRASKPRRPARAPGPQSGEPGGDRAALALWIALVALVGLRAALAFTPGMWFWGLNLQRFLSPPLAWATWALAALSLIPAFARRLAPAAARVGDALAGGGLAVRLAAALVVGALVWGNADNAHFVGDFLLRQGTVEKAGDFGVVFPQALPLDVLVHITIPGALQEAQLLSASDTARLLGALDAALLTMLAASLVRALGLRGAAAFAAWAVTVFGGYLGMFTGYSKALVELVLVAAAVGVAGVRLAREGRGALALGVALALGIALHRMAVAFLIPAGVAWGLGARRLDPAAWRKPVTWLAIALPLGTLAITARRIVSTLLRLDIAVHLAPAAARRLGLLEAAFAGPRGADFLNLVAMLSPLALIAPPLALALAIARGRSGERPVGQGATGTGALPVLLALALPLVAIAPFIHPAQGLFRDWDDFAATGLTLSLLVALSLGRILSAARARRWVAVPAAAAAMVASVQWLALHASVDRGMARARAIVTEPPERGTIERGEVWDYLGIRNFRLGRWPDAAEAFSNAAQSIPSPRMLQQWANAETMAGNLRQAQKIYHRLVEKDPRNPSAWLGLGAVASRIPDVDDAFWAAGRLLELKPDYAPGRELMSYLRETYPTHP